MSRAGFSALAVALAASLVAAQARAAPVEKRPRTTEVPPRTPGSRSAARRAPSRAKAATSPRARVAAPSPAARWHERPDAAVAPRSTSGLPKLVLVALNTRERIELSPQSDRGGFSADALDAAAQVLRDPRTGRSHPVDPHLLDLVYRLQLKFDAPEIRVISAYRAPKRRTASQHGHGRAIDIIVPGASDQAVAEEARRFGFVGVGIYPTSGFVHVDVRERSFFWVDRSAPGRRGRVRAILADEARKHDTSAAARGARPVGRPTIATDVDAAMRLDGRPLASDTATQEPHEHEEDDDGDSDG